MKVCKFGGTSVASADQIKKVAQIVKADPTRKIIVVSAPGKRFSLDDKVTDLLIYLAEKALNGEDTKQELKEVVKRYEQIAAGLGLSPEIVSVIDNDLHERLNNDKIDNSLFMDCLKASGEDNNAKLIAAYFTHIGMDAHYMCPKDAGLLVNERPERVHALPEGDDRLARLRDKPGTSFSQAFSVTRKMEHFVHSIEVDRTLQGRY